MRLAAFVMIIGPLALAGAEDQAAALLNKGKYKEAAKAAKAVAARNPKNIEAWLILADALLAQGEPEEAWSAVEDEALKKNPGDTRLLVKLGDIYVKNAEKLRQNQGAGLDIQNFYLDAMRVYDEALEKDPKSVDAVYGIAYVDYSSGKAKEARDGLARALGIKKDHARSHALQARMFYNEKKYSEAATSYATARSLDDSDPNVCYYYAHSLIGSGKKDEARAAYKYMLKRHPNDGRSISVGLKAVCDDPEKFTAGLVEWSKEITNSAKVWEYLGNDARQRSEWKACYENYAKASRLQPDDSVYYYWMGFARESSGEGSDALALYKEALKRQPGLDDAANRVERLLISGGDFDSAVRGYEKLIKLVPENANVHNNFGYMLRNWAEARGASKTANPPGAVRRSIKRAGEVYEIAAELAPDSAQIQSDTGLLFEFYPVTRDDKKAERYFCKSLERSGFLYRDAFDGLNRLCRRTGNWEILKDYAEGVMEAIDDGDRAVAPRGGAEPVDLTVQESRALRARAAQAYKHAEAKLKKSEKD